MCQKFSFRNAFDHCLYTTIVSIILKHVHAICQCSPTLQSSVVLQFLLFIPNTQHYFMKNIRQRHLNVGKPCLINYFWHTIYNACFLCLNNYFPVIFFHRFTPNKSVISHPRKNNRQQPFSIDRRCRIKGYVNRWFIKRFNGRTVFYSQSYYNRSPFYQRTSGNLPELYKYYLPQQCLRLPLL